MASTPLKKHHDSHVQPLWIYVATLVGLFIGMALTLWASTQSFPSIGPLSGNVVNNLVALLIAIGKALLVVMFFMHVKFGTSLIKLWAIIGFVWFTLLFFMFADYGTRRFEPVPGWEGQRDGGAGAMPRQVKPMDDRDMSLNDPAMVNQRSRF